MLSSKSVNSSTVSGYDPLKAALANSRQVITLSIAGHVNFGMAGASRSMSSNVSLIVHLHLGPRIVPVQRPVHARPDPPVVLRIRPLLERVDHRVLHVV